MSLQCLSKGFRARSLRSSAAACFAWVMRTSISTVASAAITLVRVPPRITPGFTDMPCCRSFNFETAVIWRASSRMALCPLPGSRPAWAATPFTVSDVFADAFARGLHGAAPAGGFEHEHGGGLSGQRFGDFARGIAADFFVGDQKDGDRAAAALRARLAGPRWRRA